MKRSIVLLCLVACLVMPGCDSSDDLNRALGVKWRPLLQLDFPVDGNWDFPMTLTITTRFVPQDPGLDLEIPDGTVVSFSTSGGEFEVGGREFFTETIDGTITTVLIVHHSGSYQVTATVDGETGALPFQIQQGR